METIKFDFILSKKDFGKIVRFQRRYYLLSMLAVLALLIADGILLGLTLRQGINWLYIWPIPILAITYGLLWFFCYTNGGVQIYNKCSLSFNENSTLTLSCTRKVSAFLQSEACFSKTMMVSRIKEKGDYWIISDNKRQWAAVPKTIPLKEMLGLD